MKDLTMHEAGQISVIVPVFNVKGYMERMVDSVLNQSYDKFELILVDDGSTDGSGDLCDYYAKNDPRVKVLHKTNSGSSDSRNLGIDIANGEYVMFVDSDDYIHKDALKLLVGLIDNDESVDIATGDYVSVDESIVGDLRLEDLPSVSYDTVLGTEDALSDMMYQRSITNSPWAKLYRRSTIGDIRYPSGKINQDLGTTYKIIGRATKIATTSHKIYFYTFRSDSVINSKFSKKRMAGLEFAKEQLRYVQNKYPLIVDAAINRLFTETVFILMSMRLSDLGRFSDEFYDVSQTLRQTRVNVLKNGKSRMIYRLLALMSFFGVYLIVVAGRVNGYRRALRRKYR